MKLTDVLEELASKLKGFTGLNVFDYPVDSFSPPVGIFSYPESITYQESYQMGDTLFNNVPLWMVTDRTDSKSARIQASKWTDPHGPESIKRFLDHERYVSCDSVDIPSVTFDIVTVAGIDYLAVLFLLNIAGEG